MTKSQGVDRPYFINLTCEILVHSWRVYSFPVLLVCLTVVQCLLPKIVDFPTGICMNSDSTNDSKIKIKIKITIISVQIENKISTKKTYIQE